MSGWSIKPTTHTFRGTGREAEVAPPPSLYAVFSDPELSPHFDDFEAGRIDDLPVLRLMEEVARLMMVRPRIARAHEPLPNDQDPEDPVVVPYSALDESEVAELFEIWGAARQKAARFLEDSARARGGAGGEDLGDDTKPAARPRAKRRSVAA